MIKLFEDFINENKIEYPKDFEVFINIAKKAKDKYDFIEQVRKIKNVNPDVSDWFFNKYENPSMYKASELFITDVNLGLYDK